MSITQTIRNHPDLGDVTPEMVLDVLWNYDIIGVSLVTLENKWVHPSPTLCEWLGYTRKQLESMTWLDVTVRSDKKEDSEAVADVLSGEIDSYKMFKTYIRRNETLMPATLVVVPIKDSELKVVMFLSQIMRDERGETVPPISEIQMVWNFSRRYKRNLILLLLGTHTAAALLGKYFLLWVADLLALLPTP